MNQFVGKEADDARDARMSWILREKKALEFENKKVAYIRNFVEDAVEGMLVDLIVTTGFEIASR